MIDLKCKKCKTLLVFNTKMWNRLIYCPNCNYLNVWSKDEEKLKNSKSIFRSVDIKHTDLYHLNNNENVYLKSLMNLKDHHDILVRLNILRLLSMVYRPINRYEIEKENEDYPWYRYGKYSNNWGKYYNSKNWRNRTQEIKEKYKGKCFICNTSSKGKSFHFHVHHLIPIENNGSNKDNNLVFLCCYCHTSIHKKPGILLESLMMNYSIYKKETQEINQVVDYKRGKRKFRELDDIVSIFQFDIDINELKFFIMRKVYQSFKNNDLGMLWRWIKSLPEYTMDTTHRSKFNFIILLIYRTMVMTNNDNVEDRPFERELIKSIYKDDLEELNNEYYWNKIYIPGTKFEKDYNWLIKDESYVFLEKINEYGHERINIRFKHKGDHYNYIKRVLRNVLGFDGIKFEKQKEYSGRTGILSSLLKGLSYWWDDTPKRDDPERFNDEVFIPILENEEIPELKSIELRESEIPVSNYLSDSIKDLTYNPNPVEVEDNTIDLPF